MNVIKFLLFVILISCQSNGKINQIKIPEETCKFREINLKFEPVIDLSSALRNQWLSSLYFYQQKKQISHTEECYKKIINSINN